MIQQRIPFDGDVTANKHGGNPESIAAHAAVNRDTIRAAVLNFIRRQGQHGATAEEITFALGGQNGDKNTYAPRVSELAQLGMVAKNGVRRRTVKHCSAAVWVAL